MKILIDDGLSTIGHLTGIGHHAYQLWLNLRKIENCKISNYRYLKILPRSLRRLIYLILVNCKSIFQNYDLIHYQNHYVPVVRGKSKRIAMIHDLTSFRFPDTMSVLYRVYNQRSLRNLIRRSEFIITPSEFIKKEILSVFPAIDQANIFVSSCGLREVFTSPLDFRVHLQKTGLQPDTYFFYVGDITPRKNLSLLLRAFIKAKKESLISENTLLVLAGRQAWGAWNFSGLLREDIGVRVLGYVSDESIVALYKYSKAVIYPSLYEGFGIPIIEAMSQNAPLIISDIGSSRELCEIHNNQMFVFAPDNEQALISHMRKLDSDFKGVRSSLNYGDISIYRYEQVAKHYLTIYQRVMANE